MGTMVDTSSYVQAKFFYFFGFKMRDGYFSLYWNPQGFNWYQWITIIDNENHLVLIGRFAPVWPIPILGIWYHIVSVQFRYNIADTYQNRLIFQLTLEPLGQSEKPLLYSTEEMSSIATKRCKAHLARVWKDEFFNILQSEGYQHQLARTIESSTSFSLFFFSFTLHSYA